MPRISPARRTLTRLLEAETDPQKKAELAAKLATVTHQENLERGRRRRANRDKPEPVVVPRDDSNDIWEVDEPFVAPILTPQLPPSSAPPAAPAPPPPPPVEVAPAPTGFTRVLQSMEFPSERESFPTAEYYQHLTFVDPLSHLGSPGTAVASFSPSGDVLDIAEEERRAAQADEQKRVTAAWDAFKESIYTREEVPDADMESD